MPDSLDHPQFLGYRSLATRYGFEIMSAAMVRRRHRDYAKMLGWDLSAELH
jgi:hypothetical protein